MGYIEGKLPSAVNRQRCFETQSPIIHLVHPTSTRDHESAVNQAFLVVPVVTAADGIT